jgi:hypothetical protein
VVYRETDEDNPVREDPEAGVVWLDFSYLPADAPPQVVGHTPHETVTRKGNVVCPTRGQGEYVTRNITKRSPGRGTWCARTSS